MRFLLAGAALVALAAADCPNSCNRHGRCVDVSKCDCFEQWEGGDCSQRKCPKANAWVDIAVDLDTAHQPALCSNRGVCDHETGECECMEGYEGKACNRMRCPEDCSSHGECRSMRYHSSRFDKGLQVRPFYSYAGVWDSEMIWGCACDSGYTGWTCQERVCPAGDDPMTTGQVDEVQLLRCDLNPLSHLDSFGTPIPRFTLSYRNAISAPFSPSATAGEIKLLLEALPTVTEVSVSYSRGTTFCNADFAAGSNINVPAGGNIVSITFIAEHGDVPDIVVLDKTGRALSGVLDNNIDTAMDGQALIYATASGASTLQSRTGTKENLPCSGRGVCNRATGDCDCFPGFYSSDGKGNRGSNGDCGFTNLPITACPGVPECSGHGTCSGHPDYSCSCFKGWQGGDCSERQCPMGKAWFSYPVATDNGHPLMECSNKGECNRETGECECQSMFEGQACERMACPGRTESGLVCSGNGRCLSMSQLAPYGTTNGDATPMSYGADPNNAYTWDGDMAYGCLCDEGYTGFDCSERLCPFGDDITLAEWDPSLTDERQTLKCELLGGGGSPSFKLRFREAVTDAIPAAATAAVVQAALEGLPTIGRMKVEFYDGGGVIMAASAHACTASPGTLMKFLFDTENGDLPPIQVVMDEATRMDDGSYTAGDGWTDTQLEFTGGDPSDAYVSAFTYIKSPPSGYLSSGVRTREVAKGTSGNVECSGRGICDRSRGVCQCFPGFGSSDGSRGPGEREDCGWREPFQGRLRGN